MKIGLYSLPMSGAGFIDQIAAARQHGIEYVSAMSSVPTTVAGWKSFMTAAPPGMAGINMWRAFAQRGVAFSVWYAPAIDADGIDWQRKAIEQAQSEGCAPHDLYAGHEVAGQPQAGRQQLYEQIKSTYPTLPVRPYYGGWYNAINRPRQKTAAGKYWIECAPCASRRECDLAGLTMPYYDPARGSYLHLQEDNPGELWSRQQIEHAHACQMPYARIVLHLNVMLEWLLTNEEYRLTLRQFQRDLRADDRYAIFMWRVLKSGTFVPEVRVAPGPPPQGDWSPELWQAIEFISAP